MKLKTVEKRWKIYSVFFESAYKIKYKLSDIRKIIETKEFQVFYEQNKVKTISELKDEHLMKKFLSELDELKPLTVIFRQVLCSKRIFIDSDIFKYLNVLASSFRNLQQDNIGDGEVLEAFYLFVYEIHIVGISIAFEELEVLMKQDMLKFIDNK